MQQKVIGIMGAMPEEITGIIAELTEVTTTVLARREYHQGFWHNTPVVVVVSGWGKVAAAATVSTLILRFQIDELIFTGVAGAIGPQLKIGDVVVASRLMQHDVDARPFIPRYEIPLLGKIYFESPPEFVKAAENAATQMFANQELLHTIAQNDLDQFGILSATVHIGDVASGDRFFAGNTEKDLLLQNLPQTLCVEMEGAAVAQICYENEIPFTIVRTISDAADDDSVIDFRAFIQNIASKYSTAIVTNLLLMRAG
jgi:adenosylhomocysteine nucleosidase